VFIVCVALGYINKPRKEKTMFYSQRTSPTALAQYLKLHSPLGSYVTTQEDGSCKLEVEVPGYGPENISVISKKGKLLVSVKTEDKTEKELDFNIASRIDSSRITAKCKNGLLTVLLPLRFEESPVAIPVT
jgi:HSP20 family molecular chaperone IbpA